jgi:hypothetical protein
MVRAARASLTSAPPLIAGEAIIANYVRVREGFFGMPCAQCRLQDLNAAFSDRAKNYLAFDPARGALESDLAPPKCPR